MRSSHARSGVGKRLMDKAEAEIAKAGFQTARLETNTFNATSQAFYAVRGYREAGCYPDKEWNRGLETILLVKTLGLMSPLDPKRSLRLAPRDSPTSACIGVCSKVIEVFAG